MNTDTTVSSLMFFTLIAAAVLAIVMLLWFRRKRSNRHPMEGIRERNIDEIHAGKPPERE